MPRPVLASPLIALLLFVGAAAAQVVDLARVTRTGVVLQQPRGDGAILTTLPPGVVIQIFGQRGEWYHVSLVSKTDNAQRPMGWIHRGVVELLPKREKALPPALPSQTTQPRVSIAPPVAQVLEWAPLFFGPDTRQNPLVLIEAGVDVHVIRAEGAWLYVTVDGSEFGSRAGYLEARYISRSSPPPALMKQASVPAEKPAVTRQSVPVTADQTGAISQPKTVGPAPSVRPAATKAMPRSAPVDSTVPRVFAQASRTKEVKIRGYVTEFRSPTDFDIEDYRVTREQTFAMDFENSSPDITFQLQDIRVGTELEIRGDLNEETGELKARAIKVDLEQFKSMKQTAFVSAAPEGLLLLDGTWAGDLRADGQVVRVTDATVVVFKPTKREKRLAARTETDAKLREEDQFEPLQSLDQVSVGMAMTYEGKRDRSTGRILAERIEFSSNDLEDGEAKLWKSLKTSVKAAQGLKSGELKIDKVGKFTLLPDADVQAFVSTLGRRLIPAYQRDLPASDPNRIPFQFHVVQDSSVNAFATPNGIVIINSGLMEMVENEAQLAAVIGHEIAHATHEHTWRQQQFHRKKRIGIAIAGALASAYGMHSLADLANLISGAIVNGHQRVLENQSDRIGLQYMIAAGYDPRQAPAVWKLMAMTNGVQATNFFWSSHNNAPTRRSYLMNELKNNYRDVDYSLLTVNAEEYSRIRAAVAAANGKKKKIKVR